MDRELFPDIPFFTAFSACLVFGKHITSVCFVFTNILYQRQLLEGLLPDYRLIMLLIIGFAGRLLANLGAVFSKDIADPAESQGICVNAGDHQVILGGSRLLVQDVAA